MFQGVRDRDALGRVQGQTEVQQLRQGGHQPAVVRAGLRDYKLIEVSLGHA